jgi:hypothetical protein
MADPAPRLPAMTAHTTPDSTFDRFLPRLAAAHDRGLLVPFIGAGMSWNVCPLWRTFISSLEAEAERLGVGASLLDGNEPALKPAQDDASTLMRRADRLVSGLRRVSEGALREAVERALYGVPGQSDPKAQTPQMKALTKTWWPLVLTTNYDGLFARGFQAKFGKNAHSWQKLKVVGRSQRDCHRVLASLQSPDAPLLWALQGYLEPAGHFAGNGIETSSRAKPPRSGRLAEELVVGHGEYRRVTHSQQHFRRAFAEVFRSRSLLFLGSGLAEPYFLDLFNEVLEFFGPSPHPHYAFVPAADELGRRIDPDFLRSRFNIIAIPYDHHGRVTERLERLHEYLERKRTRVDAWGVNLASGRISVGDLEQGPSPERADTDLTIVASLLPKLGPGEAAVVSAGWKRDGSPSLSEGGLRFAREQSGMAAGRGTLDWQKWNEMDSASQLFELITPSDGRPPIACAIAWQEKGSRDLQLVGAATRQALEWARRRGVRVLRMPLLAAGRGKHFHPRFSLIAMMRAFAAWHTQSEKPVPRLVIHVVDTSLRYELMSGRFETTEVMTARDVRFWAEIETTEGRERELMILPLDTPLGVVRRALHLPEDTYDFEIIPSALPGEERRRVADGPTLESLGVLPGATIRFMRATERTDAAKPSGKKARSPRDEVFTLHDRADAKGVTPGPTTAPRSGEDARTSHPAREAAAQRSRSHPDRE